MEKKSLLLLLGMIAIFSLIFAVTRTLCRDPDLLEAEADMERQQALAEAVVRHELVAIASGRFGAGGLLSRGRGRLSHRSQQAEQTAGVTQETRMSFIKLSAGRRASYAPSHGVAAAPLPAHAAHTTAKTTTKTSSPDDEERKSRQATGCSCCSSNSSSSGGGGGGGGSSGGGRIGEGIGGDKSSLGESGRSSRPLSSSSRKPSSGFAGGGSSSSVVSSRPRSSSKRFLLAAGGGGAPPEEEEEEADMVGGFYSDNSCSVCLDEYEEGDQLLQLTCGHVFHRPCIDHWLKGHRVCPCCRTDLDKLAQVVQLFPQTSKQVLQKALTRAEGNLVLAVEILLTGLSGRSTAGARVGDTDGESIAPPVRPTGVVAAPIGVAPVAAAAAAAAAAEAAGANICEGEREGVELHGGMTPCPARQHQHQHQQRDSPAWRSESVREGGRGGGGGGYSSSQATTPRASIDPPLPEEVKDRDEVTEHAAAAVEEAEVAAAAADRNENPRGSAAAEAPVVEAGAATVAAGACGGDGEDVELGCGGYRAGEAGARAGARAASLAAAVAAGTAGEGEGKSPGPSVAGGMAGAWAARRRSSSFTSAGAGAESSNSSYAEEGGIIWGPPLIGSRKTDGPSAAIRPSGGVGGRSSGGSQPVTGRDIAARAPPADSAAAAAAAAVGSTASRCPHGSPPPAALAAAPTPAPAPAPAPRPSLLSRLGSASPRFSASGRSAYARFQSPEASGSSSSSSFGASSAGSCSSSEGSWEKPVAEGAGPSLAANGSPAAFSSVADARDGSGTVGLSSTAVRATNGGGSRGDGSNGRGRNKMGRARRGVGRSRDG